MTNDELRVTSGNKRRVSSPSGTQHSELSNQHLSKGFTLIEVLVVISIIVFLISIVTLSGSRARARARDARRVADINTVRDALVLHLSLYGFYPDLEPCKYNISTAQDTYCPQSTNWLQVLVDRKLLSAVPRDPINAADIPLGYNHFIAPAFAAPIIIETPTPTTTPTPTATGSPLPSSTPNQTPDGTPTITPTPTITVTPTATSTGTVTATPTATGVVTPAPGASGRQYAIYSRLWPPIATFMSQNEAQMILCASKMEVDQRETLENGYPNATVASFLISIGYNPAARCLLIT